MNSLSLSRYALSVCLAGVLVVGCGGPQAQGWNAPSPLQSSAKMSSEYLKRATGGAFTAHYAGTVKETCGMFVCGLDFHGTGSGTFIGRSRLKGSASCFHKAGKGYFTFRSKRQRTDAFTVTFIGCPRRKSNLFTVTGGEGKFANASGNGTVQFVFSNNSSVTFPFTSSWTGTLNF